MPLKTYTTIQGDMWDLIAFKVYGMEAYISKLLEANEDLREITVFPSGVEIICRKPMPRHRAYCRHGGGELSWQNTKILCRDGLPKYREERSFRAAHGLG